MKLRACLSLFALIVLTYPIVTLAGEASSPGESDKQLASRLMQKVQVLARSEKLTEQHLRKIGALLDMARKCDPRNEQVSRMRLEVSKNIKDLDAALEDLAIIRELCPGDQTAQLDVVAVYLSKMETVEKKIAYLQGIMGNAKVAGEVRSAAGVNIAVLQEENGRKDEALRTLDEAAKLNPLNLTAQAMIYDRRLPKATEKQRLSMLITMVRANPTVPSLLQQVGKALAGAGMVNESATWFKSAVDNANANRSGLTLEMMIDLASAQMMSDRMPQAQEVLDGILAISPSDYAALLMRSLAEKEQGKPDTAKYLTQARNVLINSLNESRAKIGILGATTRPINEGEIFMPDLASDAKSLEKTDQQKRTEYLLALINLTWHEVYFNNKVDQADKLHQHLLGIISDKEKSEAAILARVTGWIYYRQGRKEDAKVKFAATSEIDPMSELGMIRILADEDRKLAGERAQKLMDAMAGGLNGVVISDQLKDLGARPRPTAMAPEYNAILGTLPRDWMNINTRPSNFYSLRVDPVNVSTPFGQPILVNLTLQNNSNVDLSVASDGVIQPGIWLDAQVTGSVNASIPGVAYQLLNDAMVLKARQSMKTVARIDQQQLAALLDEQPSAAISIRVVARTNPVLTSGAAACGPAGFVTDRSTPFERSAFRVSTESLSKTLEKAASGSAPERFSSIQLLTQLVLSSQTTPNPLIVARKEEILQALGDLYKDKSDPALSAWAGYSLALIKPSDSQFDQVADMLRDSDWRSQILGLYALDTMGFKTDQQKSAAERFMNSDPPARLKAYAEALIKILSAPKP